MVCKSRCPYEVHAEYAGLLATLQARRFARRMNVAAGYASVAVWRHGKIQTIRMVGRITGRRAEVVSSRSA
jgi:hypothetical protein